MAKRSGMNIDLKRQGKVILIASHNAEDIQILCDRVYRTEAGRLTAVWPQTQH